jgi:hypothetical protein
LVSWQGCRRFAGGLIEMTWTWTWRRLGEICVSAARACTTRPGVRR